MASRRTDTSTNDPATQFVAPTDPKDLVAWLDRKRETGRARLPEIQMRRALQFVLGHQWAIWDQRHNQFQQPRINRDDPNPPVRITANKIGGIVERAIAKLTKDAPMPLCRPISDAQDDADAARVGSRILEHELDRLKWTARLTAFYQWPVTLGYSYLHLYWDAEDGGEVGQLGGKPVHLGNIKLDFVPAFELAVDPNGNDPSLDDAVWAVRTTSWTKEAVWEKWGIIPEGAEAGRSLADDVYALTTNALGASTVYGSSHHSEQYVKVHQFWMRPCKAAPKGMVVTWCGNTILESKMQYPYKHGKLPFIQFDLLPGLGTREGRSWVADLIPLQIDYNDARSREATIRRQLTPKILAPTGSIPPGKITSRVEVIPYLPTGDKPNFMIPDSGWIGQFQEGMTRADQEMGERAGQNDASAGRAHASQPAASILALQEADDTKLSISVKQMNAGIERVGWMVLALVRQFWLEDRVVRAWSDADGQVEMYHYNHADLDGEYDVHIASESGVPRSAAARAQLALDLNARKIPPFDDPLMLMRFIDLPGADLIMDALTIDTRQAHRENGWMLQGNSVEVHQFDKHFIHIVEHGDFMKTNDYEQLPPEDKAIFDAHYEAHMQVISQMFQNGDMIGLQIAGYPLGGGGAGGRGPSERIDFRDVPPGVQSQMMAQAGLVAPQQLEPPAGSKSAQTGIGGPGQPGHVPGQTTDAQIAHGATARK